MNEFLQTLKKDHQELKGILKQLKENKDGPAKQRQELFKKLKMEIVPHQEGEEKAFYPALKQGEAKEHMLQGLEEHHLADRVLKELDKMSPEDEVWNAKMSVLGELIEHHIQEEESKIFKDAQSTLDDAKLKDILQKFNQEKEKVKKTLH